ncbi:MAG: hypothetical protein ACQEQV_06015 [Fibrobacterota bacterium]
MVSTTRLLRIFLFATVLLLCSALYAQPAAGDTLWKDTLFQDTLHVKSRSRGPFVLSPFFIRQESLHLFTPDSTRLPPWNFSSADNSVYFETPLPAKTQLIARYRTRYGPIKKVYRRYHPDGETLHTETPVTTGREAPPPARDALYLSGSKRIELLAGRGETAVNQGLDLTLSGNLTEETQLSGSIMDKSTTLEGDTREIGELDRLFITVDNPDWYISAGDIRRRMDSVTGVSLPPEPKGILAGISRRKIQAEGSLGLTREKKASAYFQGHSGFQAGRYTLEGSEEGPLYLVPGSVQVFVNGEQLQEGALEGEFTVDYSAKAISFTSRYTVKSTDQILVRYAYRSGIYDRLNSTFSFSAGDSTENVSLRSNVSLQQDAPRSGSRRYGQKEFAAIEKAGDSTPQILSGTPVDPQDLGKITARHRVYRFRDQDSLYRWDSAPLTGAQQKEHFTVTFRADTAGAYRPYSEEDRELFSGYSPAFLDSIAREMESAPYLPPIYLHLPKAGTHTPTTTAVLPERTLLAAGKLRVQRGDQFSLTSTVIGQNRDRNILSPRDDGNNTRGATRTELQFSTPVDNLLTTTLTSRVTTVDRRVEDVNFLSDHILERKWGISPTDSAAHLLWTEALQTTLADKLRLTLEGRQSFRNQRRNRQHVQTGLHSGAAMPFTFNYDITFTRSENTRKRMQETGIMVENRRFRAKLLAGELWENRFGHSDSGYWKGELNLSARGTHHFETRLLYHQSKRGGNSLLNSRDSLRLFVAEGALSQDTEYNRYELRSSFSREYRKNDSVSSLLLRAERDHHILPHVLISRFACETTAQSRRNRTWEYIPVPDGTGTHIKDSITGDFIPDSEGNYIASEISLWNEKGIPVTENHLRWGMDWSSSSHSRGARLNLHLNEEIRRDTAGLSAASVPGLATFGLLRVDSLLYSQRKLSGRVYVYPRSALPRTELTAATERRYSSGDSLHRYEGELHLSKRVHALTLSGRTPLKRTIRRSVGTGRRQSSALLILRQKYGAGAGFSPYLEETAGRIFIDRIPGTRRGGTAGLTWYREERGNAELSYDISTIETKAPLPATLFYGMSKGMNHTLSLRGQAQAGTRTEISGFVRSRYTEKDQWTFSLAVNARIRI